VATLIWELLNITHARQSRAQALRQEEICKQLIPMSDIPTDTTPKPRHTHSPETRRKMSEALTGRKYPGHSARMKGHQAPALAQ
jgi:hypothetical protein